MTKADHPERGAYILPSLGPMRMADIFPEHIREWITRMQREGRSAWTIQYCKTSILSSIFTTALNDQVTYIHPCRGVKIPTVPATVRTIITPEQFDVLYGALPDADAQLLVETAIESGQVTRDHAIAETIRRRGAQADADLADTALAAAGTTPQSPLAVVTCLGGCP